MLLSTWNSKLSQANNLKLSTEFYCYSCFYLIKLIAMLIWHINKLIVVSRFTHEWTTKGQLERLLGHGIL